MEESTYVNQIISGVEIAKNFITNNFVNGLSFFSTNQSLNQNILEPKNNNNDVIIDMESNSI